MARVSITGPRRALPLIESARWNRMVEELAAKLNVSLSGDPRPRKWRHPWHTVGRWNARRSRWEINVKAGSVNAAETEAPRLEGKEIPRVTAERFARAGESVTGPVRPWLSERPWFPVNEDVWRKIGPDADPAREPETVPDFFRRFGVGDAPTLEVDATGLGGVTVALPGPVARGRRLLRAADVVLATPRPAVNPVLIQIPTPNVLELGFRFQPNVAFPDRTAKPRVFLASRFIEAGPVPTLQELLATGRGEAVFVEDKVATVYLLSPEGAPTGSRPDGTWLPFVKHYLFWDRAMAWRLELASVPELRIDWTIPLAGGAAQLVIDSILAGWNEVDARVSLLLSRAASHVAFWSV